MIKNPILAHSHDRTNKARTNITLGDPYDWFNDNYFRSYGIYTVSFDFLVNWKDMQIPDEWWKKKIVSNSFNMEKIKLMDVEDLNQILNEENLIEFNNITKLAFFHNQKLCYYFIPDIQEEDWNNTKNIIVELDVLNRKTKIYNSKEIQERIGNLRHDKPNHDTKGLIWSTSGLESYLSRNGNQMWPGDADIVLYNKDFEINDIIELKKHTSSNDKYSLKQQQITNYFYRDKLKYNSLYLIAQKFNANLHILYYSVEDKDNMFILETLDTENINKAKILQRSETEFDIKNHNVLMDIRENIFKYLNN